MAAEPINIFSHKIDPRGVLGILRSMAPSLKVVGPEDCWEKIIVSGPKRLFRTSWTFAFNHDPNDGLGTRCAQYDSPVATQLDFRCCECFTDHRRAVRIDPSCNSDVLEHLGILGHRSGKLSQAAAGLLHDCEYLQCADERIASRGAIQT